jgi:hypothetical protein
LHNHFSKGKAELEADLEAEALSEGRSTYFLLEAEAEAEELRVEAQITAATTPRLTVSGLAAHRASFVG